MRNIENEIVSTNDIHLSWNEKLSATLLPVPPTSMTFLKLIEPFSFGHSVCHYKGQTYIGTQDCSVDVIDTDYKLQTSFLSVQQKHWPYGIAAVDNRLYILTAGDSQCEIGAYDLSGRKITQWNHSDNRHFTRPGITSDKIIVPDRTNSRLTVYSLTGKLIKHIYCPLLNTRSLRGTSVCAIDGSSVVVTNYETSKVFRVDIDTGETVWTCDAVARPHGAVIHGRDFVCVVRVKKISFLDAHTGTQGMRIFVSNFSI